MRIDDRAMPTSNPSLIPWVCKRIIATRPTSVLDIGVGFGKYGLLAKEYSAVWGNHEALATSVRVEGIEIHAGYISPILNAIYSKLHIGDAREIVPKLPRFDLTICADVIEHMTKAEGTAILDWVRASGGNGIVLTPAKFFEQGSVFENEYERHVCVWTKEELGVFGDVEVIDGQLALWMRSSRK